MYKDALTRSVRAFLVLKPNRNPEDGSYQEVNSRSIRMPIWRFLSVFQLAYGHHICRSPQSPSIPSSFLDCYAAISHCEAP